MVKGILEYLGYLETIASGSIVLSKSPATLLHGIQARITEREEIETGKILLIPC